MSTSYPVEKISGAGGVNASLGAARSKWRVFWADWVTERSLMWMQVGVILLVCLVSFGLGYKASMKQLTYVFFAIGGLMGFFVLLRWPGLGIIGILLSGMFIQYTGPGGFNLTMALVAMMLVLWIVEMVTLRQEIKIVASYTMPPTIAMMVAVTISFGMGQFPWFSFAGSAPLDAQLGGYAVYFLSFGAFLAIANQVREVRWLQWLTWVFILFGAIYVIQLLVPAFRSINRMMYVNMGSLFWIWFVAMVYAQALFNRDLHLGWRGALLGMIVLSVYLLVRLKYKHKSGWIPVMVLLWVITTLRSLPLGLFLLVLGGLGVAVILPDVLASEDYSLATRLEVLPIMGQILQVNPFFGVGFANYYWYTPLFALRGFYVSFNSHNNYADLLVQAGILGMIIFLWWIGQTSYLAWKLRKQVRGGFVEAYVNGAIGGLVGMIVVAFLGDWVLPFVYNIGLSGFRTSVVGWLFLGGLVVLQQIYATSSPVRDPQEN